MMNAKKSKRANLETKRTTFFLIGLVVALGSVLLAFEWKTSGTMATEEFISKGFIPDNDVFIPRTQVEKPKLPKRIIQVSQIEIVSNDKLVDDFFEDFSSESNDLEGIDFANLIYQPSTDAYSEKEEEILITAEIMPEFPGGEKALLSYLTNNVKYPLIAQETGIYGRVFVSFIVDEQGNVFNAGIIRGVDSSLDNEALRVVRGMPKWKPGRQGGKAVKVRYTVPVRFELR